MTLIKINKPLRNAFDNSSAFLDNFFGNDFFKDGLASYVPAVNISETNNSFNLELSAPGFNKENFKIEVEKNILTISGEHTLEKSEEDKSFTRKEFGFGSFRRSFTLPETANINEVNAKYETGILKLAIAKKEEAKVNPVKEIKIS